MHRMQYHCGSPVHCTCLAYRRRKRGESRCRDHGSISVGAPTWGSITDTAGDTRRGGRGARENLYVWGGSRERGDIERQVQRTDGLQLDAARLHYEGRVGGAGRRTRAAYIGTNALAPSRTRVTETDSIPRIVSNARTRRRIVLESRYPRHLGVRGEL